MFVVWFWCIIASFSIYKRTATYESRFIDCVSNTFCVSGSLCLAETSLKLQFAKLCCGCQYYKPVKARLDKFWMHQDVLYDHTADLTGIGDRSVHVAKDV